MKIEQLFKSSQQEKHDHLVYIRVFEGCNLFCEHCYIPSNPKRIDLSFFENNNFLDVLNKNTSVKNGDLIYLQWHGGEPTLMGVPYIEKAISLIENDKSLRYKHGIQTNLMNFEDDVKGWTNLYKKHFGGEVGVSWDFSIRHYKKDFFGEKSSDEFEKKFWKSVALAKENGLELYMVVTVTKLFFSHFKNPFEFFEKMVSAGIHRLNFERITKTGMARGVWDKLGLSNKEYSDNMSKFFKAYVYWRKNNPEMNLNISPFDGLLESVLSLKRGEVSGYGCWSGECDTTYHTIDSSGYKHGCTALTSEQENKNKILANNLQGKKIIWVGSSPATQKQNILNERELRQHSCVGCQYLTICSSGCLATEKFDESGECSGAKGLFNAVNFMVENDFE